MRIGACCVGALLLNQQHVKYSCCLVRAVSSVVEHLVLHRENSFLPPYPAPPGVPSFFPRGLSIQSVSIRIWFGGPSALTDGADNRFAGKARECRQVNEAGESFTLVLTLPIQ